MEISDYKETKIPTALTVRVDEEKFEVLQLAMNFYNMKVATKVIFRALNDIPELSQQLKTLRQENSKLQHELRTLKVSIKDYLHRDQKLKELIK